VRRLHDSWESFKRLVRRLARFWLSHIALPIATLAIGVGARERRWGSEPYGWGDAVFFPALALTILGFATLIVAWQGRTMLGRCEGPAALAADVHPSTG
jgi:hypothetical protein